MSTSGGLVRSRMMPPLRAISVALRGLGGDVRHARPSFIAGWARANYEHLTLVPTIESVQLHDVFPDDSPLSIEFHTAAWGLPPTETYALLRIASSIGARTIFEFGTYEGATTLAFTRACPEARIITIDLSDDRPKFTVGVRFAGLPEAERIDQIRADSTNCDLTMLLGKADLVFVDGSHEYETVRVDSRNALDIVRRGGVVVWDDYTSWTGVHRAVNEVAEYRKVWHLRGTRLAFTTDTNYDDAP